MIELKVALFLLALGVLGKGIEDALGEIALVAAAVAGLGLIWARVVRPGVAVVSNAAEAPERLAALEERITAALGTAEANVTAEVEQNRRENRDAIDAVARRVDALEAAQRDGGATR